MTTADSDGPYPCPVCNGQGEWRSEPTWYDDDGVFYCDHCHGTGQAEKPPQPNSTSRRAKLVRPQDPDDECFFPSHGFFGG